MRKSASIYPNNAEMTTLTQDKIDTWKLFVSVFVAFIGAISLIVTFFSYQASVKRSTVDRTLSMISAANESHIWEARSKFRGFLIGLANAQRTVSGHADQSVAKQNYQALIAQYLLNYKGDSMSMVGPLGDYYSQILACVNADACSSKIYCEMTHRDLVVYAEATKQYRTLISGDVDNIFASTLDQEVGISRCE
ncbi:hypothetical protein N9850_04130 [Granulosicoccus sp.]|nr:hypothetical protein [Granulosicoccus sp.]MDB4222937.1 hypothetical protein [Granulosicoccus sp.]